MGKMMLSTKNIVKQTALGRFVRDKYQRRGLNSRSEAEATVKKYLGDNIELDRLRDIVDDMLLEAKNHDFAFYEYMLYHFYDMSESERREYVSALERITFCERMNNLKNVIIFDDKGRTYQKFKKYYKRDLVEIPGGGIDAFEKFAEKHPRFIVKPFDGACGHGIKIYDTFGRNVSDIYKELKNIYKGCVAEELIVQSDETAMFHPESVNTVRITTIKYKDRIDIIYPFFRTGRGKSVVDNGGSGGIINAIDSDTGVIYGAADEMGIHYTEHPETHVKLIGYKMPKWEEAKALAKELAQIIPDNHYCGWDLALTNNGWVLQEANDRGEFVGFQLPTKKGFRKELMDILNELGV